jgi:hypothetical protein
VQMKTRVAGVIATSACAVGMMGMPAFASPQHVHVTNIKNVAFFSGNTVNKSISIPVDVCGNAVAVFGFAEASCQGGAGVFLNTLDSGW